MLDQESPIFYKVESLFKSEEFPKCRKIMSTILSNIFNDGRLMLPRYCAHVISEEYADQASKNLPLIYIWNENLKIGSFSVSVNGGIVGKRLEAFCKRDDPNFPLIRNAVMAILAETAIGSIRKVCQKFDRPPSKIFT